MTELQLINGRFDAKQAESLLTALVKVKIAFHEEKIRTVHENEEDIKHSENRIKELENNLRSVIAKMKQNPGKGIDIHANIEVSEVKY